jgi:hypothetical protein
MKRIGFGEAVHRDRTGYLVGPHVDLPPQHGEGVGAAQRVDTGVGHVATAVSLCAHRLFRNRAIVSTALSTITGAIKVEPKGDGTQWKRNRLSASRWSLTW